MKLIAFLASTFLLLLSLASHAAPEAPLTLQQRSRAIEDIAREFERIYFLPEVGERVADDLRTRLRRGEYDRITSSRKLAEVLSRHIDAICKDSHTEVAYFEEDQLADMPSVDPALAKQRAEQRHARMVAANFGFALPQRLDGNIALIRFDGFERAEDAAAFIRQLMSDTADASAIVFDLRTNTGGASDLIPVLASYLFDEQPVHLFDQSNRHLGTYEENWTDPQTAGKRFGSRKPVYILTSKDTFSAAENFAYTLQQLGRARVVGERTAGGAHGAFGRPVTSHLEPMIATKRTIHAVTKGDWSGGVVPDIPVRAGAALDAALAAARAELGAC